MLIRTRSGNTVLKRAASDFPQITDPVALRLMKNRSTAGVMVDNDKTLGIPTVVEAIRLAAQSVAMCGWYVADLSDPNVPIPSTVDWRAELIENPQLVNKFNLFQDISASVDSFGNAFVQKIKAAGQVVGLRVIDANRVQVNVDKKTGAVTYDISNGPGVKAIKGLTDEDILHIRGFVPTGLVSGRSLVQTYAQSLGNILAIEEFSGRWWSQSGTTSQVIQHPEILNNTQAEQILDMFEESHTGLHNAGRPALLTGGAKLESVQITAEDAQLIASRDWSIGEIARMCNVPSELLEAASHSEMAKTEELMSRWLTLYVLPRVERIRAAFNDDPDLFAGSPFWLEVNWDKLRVVDAQYQGTFYLAMRQGGILTANEIRGQLGYDPHPNGDVLQITPVGGGANPSAPSPSEPAEPDSK